MVDTDIVAAKLGELARRVDKLRRLRPSDRGELTSDDDLQDLLALNLMVAVQCCLDVATHIIADRRWVQAPSMAATQA